MVPLHKRGLLETDPLYSLFSPLGVEVEALVTTLRNRYHQAQSASFTESQPAAALRNIKMSTGGQPRVRVASIPGTDETK